MVNFQDDLYYILYQMGAKEQCWRWSISTIYSSVNIADIINPAYVDEQI